MCTIYDNYVEAVKKQLDNEELTFKSDPSYQKVRLEDERPLTGPINKFVYF